MHGNLFLDCSAALFSNLFYLSYLLLAGQGSGQVFKRINLWFRLTQLVRMENDMTFKTEIVKIFKNIQPRSKN